MRIPPSPAIQRISRVFKPKEKELGKMYRVRTGLARGRSPAVLPAAEGVWQSSLQPSPPSLELGAIGNLERPSDLLGLVVVDPDVDSGKELQFSTIAAQPHTSRRSRSQLSSDETLGSFCKNFLSLQAGLWSSTGWKPAEAPGDLKEQHVVRHDLRFQDPDRRPQSSIDLGHLVTWDSTPPQVEGMTTDHGASRQISILMRICYGEQRRRFSPTEPPPYLSQKTSLHSQPLATTNPNKQAERLSSLLDTARASLPFSPFGLGPIYPYAPTLFSALLWLP
ncbi:uncharacterized protein LOC117717906 isoform X1 [Arvicanthis niloticus]|uniref:uncharacterized protein LOC117717906 isoform X1 n=1 Tax=Arvicanthis niloticus TaxID=61156 RepID=UPI00402B82A7